MPGEPLTSVEQSDFKKYFGSGLDEISLEDFNKIRKQLQAKYHPDNFEKHGDETIKEMAVEKFQHIEALCSKAKHWLENKSGISNRDAGDVFFTCRCAICV